MITVCTPLEPRTIAKIADSAMALSRKKPCFFVKIGTRSLGQCWITTHIAATRMIARSAPSRSSPAPSARRYAALGLDRSARPSKRGNHAANAYLTMLARTEDKRSSDSVRQVEYWFPQVEAVFDIVERIRRTSIRFHRDEDAIARRDLEETLNALTEDRPTQIIRAFSFFSHLANIAEDQHHIRRTRAHALVSSAPRVGTMAHALGDAREAGISSA